MYVKRVFYDDYQDLLEVEKSIESPAWNDVERVIDMLDGKRVTQIMMDNGNEDNYICIGGGNGGLCNVYVSENDNEEIYTLVNPNAISCLEHKLVTGGQEGDFEDQICVSIELAKRVAIKYYESGELDNSFEWK